MALTEISVSRSGEFQTSTVSMSELPTSVAACLLAEACNVGFAPIIQPGHRALGRARLSHVNQNYLRAENHRAANACLIDAQAGIDLVAQWGTGQLASVDGLRFVVPPASVRASANPRHFGQRGTGVTWLNYVNDQVAGLGGIVVTGTIRDSLHVLDGLLDLGWRHPPRARGHRHRQLLRPGLRAVRPAGLPVLPTTGRHA
jgi:hypothetical protein